MNGYERFAATLTGHAADRVPVFPLLMDFAASRAKMSYRRFASDGTAMAAAQIGITKLFPVDAITACSDAFRITADLGAEMSFPEDKPPHAVVPLVQCESDIAGLGHPDPTATGSRMEDRVRAVELMAKVAKREIWILGWVDMPFAEAASVCGVTELMMMVSDQPAAVHRLLEHLTGIVIEFALAQVRAGADMIGAGDAVASLVSPEMYTEFVLPYERRVVDAVHSAGATVKLHICGNTSALLPEMVSSGADLFNVDHLVNFILARDVYTSAGLAFKGNLDPVADLLQSTPETARKKALECLRLACGSRYMLSAGCEVPAAVDDTVFRAFCEAPQCLTK